MIFDNPSKAPMSYGCNSDGAFIKDLSDALAELCKINSKRLYFVEVLNHRIYATLDIYRSTSEIRPSDEIYAFEIPKYDPSEAAVETNVEEKKKAEPEVVEKKKGYEVGDQVDAQDHLGKWYASEIVDVRQGGNEIFIHYIGWGLLSTTSTTTTTTTKSNTTMTRVNIYNTILIIE